MTGPEHYLEAERLLESADRHNTEGDPQTASEYRLEALVRAVLALTASHAGHAHPQSTSWDHAINQTEQP